MLVFCESDVPSAGLGRCPGQEEAGVSLLDRMAGCVEGAAIRLQGPIRTRSCELGPFSLPDLVPELTPRQKGPGFERTLAAFPREHELATGDPGQQHHGGIVIDSGAEKLGLGCQRRDLAEGRTFQPGGEVVADLPEPGCGRGHETCQSGDRCRPHVGRPTADQFEQGCP